MAVGSGRRVGVEVKGLREFRAELKKLESDTNWAKEMVKVEKAIAGEVVKRSQSAASSFGPQQRHFASAIKPSATARDGARITVSGKTTPAGKARANPAFWGSKAQGNWIGTSWDVGGPGGPYAINDAIRDNADQIVAMYGAATADLAKKAFPN